MTCQATLLPYSIRFLSLMSQWNPEGRRHGWVIRLDKGDGRVGYGDCAPWPGFGSTFEQVEDALTKKGALREPQLPEIASAVQWALADIEAQGAGQSLAKFLNPNARDSVAAHELVKTVDEAYIAVRLGVPALKIKVGRASLDSEQALVAAMREAVGDDVKIRLDANAAWSLHEALGAVSAFEDLNIDYIEQPVESIDDLRRVREHTSIRIAADESVTTPRSIEALVEAKAADVAIVKPAFMGGVARTLECIRDASSAGLECIVTHAFESAVGRLIALHVAAGVPADLPCGIAPQSVADVSDAYPEDFIGGRVQVPTGPGIGVGALGGES